MTEFIDKKVWTDSEPWEYADHFTKHTITGELADRIQARSGKTGVVTITEASRSWGTCELCGGEGDDFTVAVNDFAVFTDDVYLNGPERLLSPFGRFQEWLVSNE